MMRERFLEHPFHVGGLPVKHSGLDVVGPRHHRHVFTASMFRVRSIFNRVDNHVNIAAKGRYEGAIPGDLGGECTAPFARSGEVLD